MPECVLRCFSRVRLFVTPWTIVHQDPLSMGFSRQEYWSGLLCPPPGDLPHPGIEPVSLMPSALAAWFFTTSATREAHLCVSGIRVFVCTWAAQVVKNMPDRAGDVRDAGLILGSGRSPRGGQSNPLQYSYLENPHGQRSLAGYSP